MYSLSRQVVDVKASANKIIVVSVPAPNENNTKIIYQILSLVNNEIQNDGWSLSTSLTLLKPEFSDNFFSIISQSNDENYTLYVSNYISSTAMKG